MSTRTGSAGLRTGVALALAGGALGAASARAEPAVDVEAQLDSNLAGIDQVITLTVTVTIHGNGNLERITLPRSPALRELGTSTSEQSSFSLGSGGMNMAKTTSYRVSLSPLQTGDFTLSPALAVVDGHGYRGPPLRVKILPAGQGPSAQTAPRRRAQSQNPFNAFGAPPGLPNPLQDDSEGDPFAELFGGGRPPGGSDLFLASAVDRRQVYLGQQLTYTVRLFTRVDVNEFDDLKLPGFDGFWGEDLETPSHPIPTLQNVGGVTYQVFLIKKKALFPSRAGTLTIAPAEVDVVAGGLFFRGHKLHKATNAIKITVLPLPVGAPPGFSTSDVGHFRLAASLTPEVVPVGEPASFVLSAEGVGNLHALVLPTLPRVPGLRAYDPTSTDKTAVTGDRFGGQRRTETVLIGERTGTFLIPKLTFTFFDPTAGTYRTETTPELPLKVVPAAGRAGIPAGGGQNLLEASFRPLKSVPSVAGGATLPPLRGPLLWAVAGVPPTLWAVVWGALELRRRRERSAPGQRIRRAHRAAMRELRAAKALLTGADHERALGSLTLALGHYLEDRTSASVLGLPHADLQEHLRSLGATDAAAAGATAALEACEARRYAPGPHGAAEIHDLLSRVEFAIDALERCPLRPSTLPRSLA